MNINDVRTKIGEERERAEKLHPDWPKDIVYRAAIVCEEAGEFLKAVLDYKSNKGSADDVIKEAIQTGAMIERFLINVRVG